MRRTTVHSKVKPTVRTKRAITARRKSARTRPIAAKPGLPGAALARRKFLRAFPGGFRDETFVDWERAYKWNAHRQWHDVLGGEVFLAFIAERRFQDIAQAAIRIESRTNLLFSFEKMALRDAVRSEKGARCFATALFELLHGEGSLESRFARWIDAIEMLPRRQTRVLTWPLATVFGFIAQPRTHFFFKPTVTRAAARRYGVELPYASRPSWDIYKTLLQFVGTVRADIRDLRPRDMIDMQSFLWVQGSDEYPD
jgi:hypothetical protein